MKSCYMIMQSTKIFDNRLGAAMPRTIGVHLVLNSGTGVRNGLLFKRPID